MTKGTNIPVLLLICLMIFMLASCSHLSRRDGPPNYNVDVSTIPNAIPKPERLSKYGNMSSYRVFGKRYYPMKSSIGYEAVGIASWYGSKFHAQRTSSGERYNMLGMTAAHKTLPLPTYVEVTNLKNHRTIIVKVNDRGPFESSRIIDLSYVAAKKLGMLGRGTSLVRVKAIDPAYTQPAFFASRLPLPRHTYAYAAPKPIHANPIHTLYLQVGAFRNKVYAERLQHRLAAMLAMPVKIAHRSEKNRLYHVQVGPINNLALANQITHRLKGLGIRPNKVYGA